MSIPTSSGNPLRPSSTGSGETPPVSSPPPATGQLGGRAVQSVPASAISSDGLVEIRTASGTTLRVPPSWAARVERQGWKDALPWLADAARSVVKSPEMRTQPDYVETCWALIAMARGEVPQPAPADVKSSSSASKTYPLPAKSFAADALLLLARGQVAPDEFDAVMAQVSDLAYDGSAQSLLQELGQRLADPTRSNMRPNDLEGTLMRLVNDPAGAAAIGSLPPDQAVAALVQGLGGAAVHDKHLAVLLEHLTPPTVPNRHLKLFGLVDGMMHSATQAADRIDTARQILSLMEKADARAIHAVGCRIATHLGLTGRDMKAEKDNVDTLVAKLARPKSRVASTLHLGLRLSIDPTTPLRTKGSARDIATWLRIACENRQTAPGGWLPLALQALKTPNTKLQPDDIHAIRQALEQLDVEPPAKADTKAQ